jgi:drug/metabolite transporter (DMT)-like permease
MTLIWGTNYSIVKSAFREIDPQAFNAMRMTIGSAVFLVIMAAIRRWPIREPDSVEDASVASIFHTPAPITGREWLGLIALGVVGHFFYQYLFIGGLARTSVANSSLMLALTPVVIALSTAALGHDRVGRLHWLGAGLSMLGIYAVVGGGATVSDHTLVGDVMMFGAVSCWAAYTLAARQLMTRHSPVGVTGISMAVGTALYVPAVWPHLRAVAWTSLSAATWGAIVYSALFALCVAYTIWYAAVRQIGSARTSVYSNLIPLVAMLTAVVFLGEPLSVAKIIGACAVLVGVALTKVGKNVQTGGS